jgi:DNA-binding MarR family transcriptional regulator
MLNNNFTPGELFAFLTGKASTAMGRHLLRKFVAQGVNLTVEQWSVLYSLWRTNAQSQQQLATHTDKDRPSITRLIDNLEKLELVQRQADATDRRIKTIVLTAKGKKLETLTLELANQTLNEALEQVPKADLDVAKRVLKKVYQNLK